MTLAVLAGLNPAGGWGFAQWFGTVATAVLVLVGTVLTARYSARTQKSTSIDDLVQAALDNVLTGYKTQQDRDGREIGFLRDEVTRLRGLELEVSGLRAQVVSLTRELERLAGVERDNANLRVELQASHGHVSFLKSYIVEHQLQVPDWSPQMVPGSVTTPPRPPLPGPPTPPSGTP